MSLKFNETNFFKLGSNGIVSFKLTSSQPTMDDVVIQPSRFFLESSSPMNFYFPNSTTHNRFKSVMLTAPVTPVAINMYDMNGNNIGKYSSERKSNDSGNIQHTNKEITFLNDITIHSDNCVLFLEDYYPFGKFTSELTKNFLKKDAEMCGDKFKNTIVYMKSKLYKQFAMLTSVDINTLFKQVVIVTDSDCMAQTCIEHFFGRVIVGKSPHVSTFLTLIGCELKNIIADCNGCTISHRSDNRIQFISDSSKAEATIVCFVKDFPETVCLEMDDRWKSEDYVGEVTSPLDISTTPQLDISFYENLFNLRDINSSITDSNFKEVCMLHSELVVGIMLSNFEFDTKTMNTLEKMLVGNYNSEMSRFSDKFVSYRFPVRTPPMLARGPPMHTPTLLRETTHAVNW